jgi:hypothetical protein
MTLNEELTKLLNIHSVENRSNTPDFILAEFMLTCLRAYEKASKDRESWYGQYLYPGRGSQATSIPDETESHT